MKAYTTMLAHSGATIGIGDPTVRPAIDGEVPTSYPTVSQQVAGYTGDTDTVDLVLVTAGLNDVNFRSIVNPVHTARDFTPLIERHCHQDLRTLLLQVTSTFPNATDVATGYYPIFSDSSATGGLEAMLVALGITVAGLPGGLLGSTGVPQIRTNCRAFHELSTLAIAAAVDDANDLLPTPRILFADAAFRDENAALAPEAWVFAVNGDLSPQDNLVAPGRAMACTLNSARTSVFQCERASVGHPNPAGARAYADAIMAALERGHDSGDAALPGFPPASSGASPPPPCRTRAGSPATTGPPSPSPRRSAGGFVAGRSSAGARRTWSPPVTPCGMRISTCCERT